LPSSNHWRRIVRALKGRTTSDSPSPCAFAPLDAELELITTLTYFGTAVDVAVAELRLEAFLPADEATATALANLVAAAS
jgi:hypothetical protein